MNEGEVGNEGTQEEESLSSLHPLNTSCELSLLWYVSSCATVFVTLAVLCLMEIVNSSQQTPPVSFLLSVVCPPMALCICSYSRSRYSLLTILPSLNNKNKIITKNKQLSFHSTKQETSEQWSDRQWKVQLHWVTGCAMTTVRGRTEACGGTFYSSPLYLCQAEGYKSLKSLEWSDVVFL